MLMFNTVWCSTLICVNINQSKLAFKNGHFGSGALCLILESTYSKIKLIVWNLAKDQAHCKTMVNLRFENNPVHLRKICLFAERAEIFLASFSTSLMMILAVNPYDQMIYLVLPFSGIYYLCSFYMNTTLPKKDGSGIY